MKRYPIIPHHETIAGCLHEINLLRKAAGIQSGLNGHREGFSEPSWRRGSLQRWRLILMAQYRQATGREWAYEEATHAVE